MAGQGAATVGSGHVMHVPHDQSHLAPIIQIGNIYVPGMYHSEYIRRLDYRSINPRQYRHERRRGTDHCDITSFLSSQREWGGKREQRPEILFDLYKPAEQNLPETGYLFTPSPTLAFPELRVVIDDYEGEPLLNYAELPIMISTKVEGWLIEAWMRSNLKISIEDILQRMAYLPPEKRATAHGHGGFCNTLSGRRRDFRKMGRCLSWAGNSANASVYDCKIIDEVEANPEWHHRQTTRYLEDLTKGQRDRLEKENTAVSTQRKAGKQQRNGSGAGSGNESSPFRGDPALTPEITPGPQDEEGQHSTGRASKRARTHKEYVRAIPAHFKDFGPRIDNTGYEFDPIFGLANRQNSSEAPPMRTHMSPVFVPAQSGTKISAAGWLPGWSPFDKAGLSVKTAMPGAPPPPELLLYGQALIEWFAGRFIPYLRRDYVQLPHPLPDDQRYTPTTNSQDRMQLFFALYPSILFAVHTHERQRFLIDLDTSYSTAYNELQDQFVHAAFLADNNVDLNEQERRLQPRGPWTGSLESFDDTYLVDVLWDDYEREKIKTDSCSYALSPEFERKAGGQGWVGIDKKLLIWPSKIMVELKLGLREMRNVVTLVDYE